MTIQEAIKARHSVRQYTEQPIGAEKIQQLQELIDQCNREGNLHIQLVIDEPNAFSSIIAHYSKFRGVRNYIAMVCKKGDDVNLGYYGEKVVLLAQMIGLNTCWVGASYRKQPDRYKVESYETLVCVVSFGYGATQGVQHSQKRTITDVAGNCRTTDYGKPFPKWFVCGIEAALLAPTAVNQQKFAFYLHDNNQIEEAMKRALFAKYAPIDLGIAKCHFEIGAGKENFDWL